MLNEPIFDKMKEKSLWTVSSTNTKMPLDLQWLIDHYGEPNAVRGATYQDHRSLGTYKELESAIPDHINATYYYQIAEEDFLFLDIEPKCPDHIRKHLLTLPYVYGEVSMSGKGIHLLLPKPKNINDYPDALVKVRLQEKNGYYELLMNHYATFTGKTIPLLNKNEINDFTDKLYKSLAKDAVATKSIQLMDSEITDIDDIPFHEYIMELVLRKPFQKTFDDYGNNSTYEFGMMNYYGHRVYRISDYQIFKSHKYSDQDLLAILYHIIQQELEHRPKHDETRHDSSGNPVSFLLWRCNAAMSQVIDYYRNQKKKK